MLFEMNKTIDVTVLLDRSGSMCNKRNDTIGGFNTFVKEQKESGNKVLLTLVQFDHKYQVDYSAKPIEEVEDLTERTYIPRGDTALLHAVGQTIANTKERTLETKPKSTMFVIITDGEENCSKDWKLDQVKKLIEEQKTAGWDFIFLGADQDAFQQAASMGIAANNTLSYSGSKGTQSAFTSVRRAVSKSANFSVEERSRGVELNLFDQEDYEEQRKLGLKNSHVSSPSET